jgi:cytochrome c biogenesis protein ResB
MRLNSFEATYGANGQASDYVSNVTVFDRGTKVRNKDIRVNDFLSVDGVNVYQQDYGWARPSS